MDVFINDISKFLPNKPVNNEEIEDVLGRINNISSRAKRIVLRNNKIKTRYYAIDSSTQRLTHSNAQLTAEAVRGLKPFGNFSPDDIECIVCGTSTPDLLLPGHSLMVLGELGITACDAVSTSGICISGMTALKYGYLNIAAGDSMNAVTTGTELASSFFRANFFTPQPNVDDHIDKKPLLAFDADFLRWMLSDGAGAVYMSNKKNETSISFKIDWIDNISYAGTLETCMYAGGSKNEDCSVSGWRDTESIDKNTKQFVLSVRQDIRLLERELLDSFDRALERIISKYNLDPDNIDWFLPHYSSAYFKPKFYDHMKNMDFEIPFEKWFTNLSSTGNTGSAAIYIIMEELFKSGRLEKGQKLLCFIPESGRFSHCFMMLTVV